MTRPRRIAIESDSVRIEIDHLVGASLAAYETRDPRGRWHPVMRPTSAEEHRPGRFSSFLMAPWCNRIAAATLRSGGREFALRATGADGSAQHGDVRGRPWQILDRSPVSARLGFDSAAHADVNFPWRFRAEVRYELAGDALTSDLHVQNTGDAPIPVGCGHHPYFQRRLWHDGDELELHAPVGGRYPLRLALPVAPARPDSLSEWLCAGGPFPSGALDEVFAGFAGRAVLTWPASNVRVVMEATPELGHLVVYAPVENGGPAPFVAVEPVSNVNNGFNLASAGWAGTGTVVVDPAASLRTRLVLRLERG